jgi:hypothetical protein
MAEFQPRRTDIVPATRAEAIVDLAVIRHAAGKVMFCMKSKVALDWKRTVVITIASNKDTRADLVYDAGTFDQLAQDGVFDRLIEHGFALQVRDARAILRKQRQLATENQGESNGD